MEHNESFRLSMLNFLEQCPSNLPIIASLGKKNCGKSSFMRFILHDNYDVQELNRKILDDPNSFSYKKYQDLVLVKMHDLESQDDRSENTLLRFSSCLALADILFLHISHTDLQNDTFIQTFASNYLQSVKTCLKYRQDLPNIIILVRDPQWLGIDPELYNEYKNIVELFLNKVNYIIDVLFRKFCLMFEEEAIKSSDNENEKKENIEAISKLREELPRYHLEINNFYVVYCQFDNQNNKPWYYGIEPCSIAEKDFQVCYFDELSQNILRTCHEKRQISDQYLSLNSTPISGIRNEMTNRIQIMLQNYSNQNPRRRIFEHIRTELKYNIFTKYKDESDCLKLLRYFTSLRKEIDKINTSIISTNKTKFTEIEIQQIRNKHQNEIERLISENIDDRELMISIIGYFKYITAITFANTFSVTPNFKDSYCYEAFEYIFFFSRDDEIISNQFSTVETNLCKFRCLFYYDEEMEDIIKTLIPDYFKIYESIFCIYKDVIDCSLRQNYKYKEIFDKEAEIFMQNNYIENLEKLVNLLSNFIVCDFMDVKEFLSMLKSIHIQALLNKKNTTEFYSGENVLFKELSKTVKIFTTSRISRLFPSLSGLTSGVINTARRCIIEAAATKAVTTAVAALSAAWVPVVGWTIFGLSTAYSGVSIFYSIFRKDINEKIVLSYTIEDDTIILDAIIFKNHMNGKLSGEKGLLDNKTFTYEIVLTNDKNALKSAFLDVKCYIAITGRSLDYVRG
ncbi:hypothetical protein SteCoe_22728 [Stentor coeruleus]|uniref:Uncharacterized protein n=1 Tax=Stentor coeruleus TaxID=5963 RepID=A0A1R2BLK9_9CILI|nr:hypothetical protein SteCoe_22728 [Stentor coeruleus]